MQETLHVVVGRPEFAAALQTELRAAGHHARALAGAVVGAHQLPGRPLVFEHQRLPNAHFLSADLLKPISDATWHVIMGELLRGRHRWTLHAWSRPPDQQARVDGIAHTLVRLARKLAPELDDLYRPPHRAERMDDALVLQLCLTPDGLWHSTAPMEELSSRQPGGAVRMKDDPAAPSRSYLKIEEAFYRLNEWPQPGQRAVDLGAAPGGWTMALAKRGCQVTAVDNGPMKLPPPAPDWGTVEHLRRDGLSFALPAGASPVDWLVADMLVPPLRAADTLRRWLRRPDMARFILNIKLPHGDPLAALRPVRDVLERHPAFHGRLCHLYHDREEITVLGRLQPDVTRLGS
jgi:23S rRNA (cytidine2498-2'-O)-methyltransferase